MNQVDWIYLNTQTTAHEIRRKQGERVVIFGV